MLGEQGSSLPLLTLGQPGNLSGGWRILRALPSLRPQLGKEWFCLGASAEETTEVARAGRVGGACPPAILELPPPGTAAPPPTTSGAHLSRGGKGCCWGD